MDEAGQETKIPLFAMTLAYSGAIFARETRDLSQSQPEKLAELTRLMQHTYSEVVAEGPIRPEWTWPKYEAQRIEWPDYPIPKKKR